RPKDGHRSHAAGRDFDVMGMLLIATLSRLPRICARRRPRSDWLDGDTIRTAVAVSIVGGGAGRKGIGTFSNLAAKPGISEASLTNRWSEDSPLEGSGCEPSVPRRDRDSLRS